MTFFRKRQQKELEQVLTERDILGTQLVRRNDELALLHEKTKLNNRFRNIFRTWLDVA